MDDSSNGLSEAEVERLALLLEEMGEATQIIGKVMRHGYASCDPTIKKSSTNRELLELEVGHVLNAVKLMVVGDDLDGNRIEQCRLGKAINVKSWLHHQTPQVFHYLPGPL